MKKIIKEGRNCMGVFKSSASGLLIDGRDYYEAFYRASLKARRYILIAGWQFDSRVALLRGRDAEGAECDVHLLPFLNELCERNPHLQIYILAWDFNIIYSLDREVMQDWLFNWNSNRRIRFLFDNKHALGASHHQKFAVIDGVQGFVGGMDICSNRWDDRRHLPDNPERKNYHGEAYEQYHDIQTFHIGPVVKALREIFVKRWNKAGGPSLVLPAVPDASHETGFPRAVTIEAPEVAVSRTQSKTILPPGKNIREIRSLYLDAIWSAKHLIYIENQYFSSQAVFEALMERMRDTGRPPLRIVLILPKQPHSLIENISLGIAQAKMLQVLSKAASESGHTMGIYYTAPLTEDGFLSPTYIHSKLLLVDDRFLSIGSANTSNRSMGLDTELNVSWEASSEGRDEIMESIKNVRTNLLAEHCGINDKDRIQSLRHIDTLASSLNGFAHDPAYRLRHYTIRHFIDNIELLKNLKPEDFAIDPERPVLEENVYDLISRDKTGFFAQGISWLNDYLNSHQLKEQSSTAPDKNTFQDTPMGDRGPFQTAFYKAVCLVKRKWYIYVPALLLFIVIIVLLLR